MLTTPSDTNRLGQEATKKAVELAMIALEYGYVTLQDRKAAYAGLKMLLEQQHRDHGEPGVEMLTTYCDVIIYG